MSETSGVVHIAGVNVQVGCFLRQRCSWCGAVLKDYNVCTVAFEESDTDRKLPVWEIGGLVLVDGDMSYSVPHVDGGDLPDNACAVLDPMVTA